MDFHYVNCMYKCNVSKKKTLIISTVSNNNFSQETAVLRKSVAQYKTLPPALFAVVIVFILCACKSRLYFAVGQKKKTLIPYFYYFFVGLRPAKYFSNENC